MPKMTQFPLSPPCKKNSPLKRLLAASSVPSPLAPVPPALTPPASCVYSCSPLIIHIPAASLSLHPPPPCLSLPLSPSSPLLPLSITQKLVRLVPDCWRQASLQEKNKAKEKGMQGKTAPPHEHTSNQPFISPECSPLCRAPYPVRHTHTLAPIAVTLMQHGRAASAHAPAEKSKGANTRSIIYQCINYLEPHGGEWVGRGGLRGGGFYPNHPGEGLLPGPTSRCPPVGR